MFTTRNTRRIGFPDRVWRNFDELFDVFNEEFVRTYEVSNEKEFSTELPLPGLAKENLSIEVTGRTLIIKTKVKNPSGFLKRYQDNSYSYHLSSEHDLNETEAKMENGLLKITVPLKTKNETKSVNIEIK